MHRGRFGAILALVAAVGLVAAACGSQGATPSAGGGSEETEEGGGTITVAGQQATDHGQEDVSGMSDTSLELDDFYFEPTVLVGEAGQELSIELENEGQATHTFTIDDLGIDEEIQPGDSVETEVTFPDSGALPFYCRFHTSRGMNGGLSVGGDLEAAVGASGGGGSGGGGSGSGGGGGGGPGYG
jgi:plastocyanin